MFVFLRMVCYLRDQRGSFLKHKFGDSTKSLSRSCWNINRTLLLEFLRIYIVTSFRDFGPSFSFRMAGCSRFLSIVRRQVTPMCSRAPRKPGSTRKQWETRVPAWGKASVSDATPLWSDQSDLTRRTSRTLAKRNRTRVWLEPDTFHLWYAWRRRRRRLLRYSRSGDDTIATIQSGRTSDVIVYKCRDAT